MKFTFILNRCLALTLQPTFSLIKKKNLKNIKTYVYLQNNNIHVYALRKIDHPSFSSKKRKIFKK